MAIKYIALRFGSGRSTQRPVLFFEARSSFATPIVALQNLGNELFQVYLNDRVDHSNCGFEAIDSKWAFCPGCGNGIFQFHGDVVSFLEWLYEIDQMVLDNFEQELASWSSFPEISSVLKARKDQVLCIEHNAENVLAAAVDPSKVPEPYRAIMSCEASVWKDGITELMVGEYHKIVPFHKQFSKEFDGQWDG